MPVATYGIEQGRHCGGGQLDWGGQTVQFRRSVHICMVNVGASSMVDRNTPELGYPVCEICGYSVSPLASERQLQTFREGHQQRCEKEPSNIGFYADVVADALTLNDMDIHGNSATAEIDNEIRSWLKNNGYQVIAISYVDLSDKNAMKATHHIANLNDTRFDSVSVVI